MEHVIFFTAAGGSAGFARVGERDEAVAAVERLRNADGASDVELHVLTPVPLTFRPYYRVELAAAEQAAQAAAEQAAEIPRMAEPGATDVLPDSGRPAARSLGLFVR